MSSTYEILEGSHETSVYKGDEMIAVFFDQPGSTSGVALAQRFVDREEYLERLDALIVGESAWVSHIFSDAPMGANNEA